MKRLIWVIIFLLIPITAPVYGASLSVEEIVNRANLASYYGGDDGRAEVSMTITDNQGRQRIREFVILRKDKEDGGEQFFYVFFKKPSDVRKMVFLVHKHLDRDDDRWLYLPALDLIKRIAASDKRTSFVGSNFFYEDISGRGLKEDKHQLMKTTDKYYVINNIPNKPDEVEFSSYTVWIDKITFMPMKAEYLDKNNKKYRVVEVLEVKNIQDYPTVIRSRASDLAAGSNTVSVFKNIRYNIGLKENIFSERYLRRPPREVRK